MKRSVRARHVNGWLLLLPALLFLTLFTYWPAAKTVIESFYSTARPRRPSHFVGLDQYRQMIDDPVFWQALTNNLWYALISIPAATGLALLMALWVNDRIPGRALTRMA